MDPIASMADTKNDPIITKSRGFLAAMLNFIREEGEMSSFLLGTLGGLISCLSTCIGALPAFFRKPGSTNLWKFVSLDFTLGMMLAASAFSLIFPAYQGVSAANTGPLLAITAALIGGILFIRHLGEVIGKLQSPEVKNSQALTRAWLFVTAMMIHNFPEGLASGASLNVENLMAGVTILSSISLQNLPEGLMTALAFQSLGMSPKKAFFGAVLTGVMELSGGMVGGALSGFTTRSLPFMLAFAGGAMLYVSTKELWTQSKGHPEKILWKPSFAVGFLLMTSLSLISISG